MQTQQELWQAARQDPQAFWGEAALGIDWVTTPKRILDDAHPPFYRWYSDGSLNTCFNALDRHVLAGRGERVALIHDSPLTQSCTQLTYAQLLDEVSRAAGALHALGVQRGDRVVIYLPMVPAAIIAMLACARLGAVHSVVFGGFAAAELAARIDDAQPKAIITASCGLEPGRIVEYWPLVSQARELAQHQVEHVLLLQRPQHEIQVSGAGVIDWATAVRHGSPIAPVEVAATDPLYILYTSGTTGRPKGIVRDNGGHAVAMAWSFANIYGMTQDDTWWSASDVGWLVGHSYIVYAPLISGATTVMYEGKPIGTPDAGAFWRVIQDHRIASLFTAPTAIRAIKKEDPEGKLIGQYDLSSLRTLFLAGERLDPATYEWATDRLGVPVVDNWWQTETGWPICATMRGVPSAPIRIGSPGHPVPGFQVQILGEPAGGASGAPGPVLPAQTEGAIVIELPMPPGTLPTLWGDDDRYQDSYLSTHPGYYTSGDGGFIDEDGYVFVMGRTDDTINVAGHRLTTGSMEAVVAAHPMVAECAVIGVSDAIKGQIPRAFVVLKAGAQIDAESLQEEVVAMVREQIGPVAALKSVLIVPALPKTRSGKILRRSMRAIAEGRDEPIP
ncbi:MAG: AMP-binding protein, partial [Actinomycetales bacterium]